MCLVDAVCFVVGCPVGGVFGVLRRGAFCLPGGCEWVVCSRSFVWGRFVVGGVGVAVFVSFAAVFVRVCVGLCVFILC